MIEDTGFAEQAAEPEPEVVAEPPSGAETSPAGAGPPQPATEPEDHVPPPWIPDTQPDWLHALVLHFHKRLRDLERQ